ncbi:MAG: SPOR domain-containing protein [Candidatus Cyclobacteriaceae bacterium M2_1C_046]
MAKKKKNDLDENDDINEGRSDDINEADDNFGLPDVDYTPVEEETTKKPEEEEPVAEENTDYASSQEETAYESSAADDSTPTTETTSTYEPGSYRPPKEESNAPKIIILIAVILLVGAGIWYFGFYSPQQKAEQARIEQEQRDAEEAQLAEDRRQEQERQQQLEAQREAERLAAEEEAAAQEPQEGSFEILSSRTGNYYVVVSSSLDSDLATDFGRRLAQEGLNTKLLEPTGNNKFHRVAVAGFDTWASAQEKADELKGRFGENVWVVKY